MSEQLPTDKLTEFAPQPAPRRRTLLPWWIKVFAWIFLIFGGLAVLGLIVGALGFTYELSLYGIETHRPYSLAGLAIITLMIIKGATAYGLLFETDWAINLGQIDAGIGIIISIFVMVYDLTQIAESSSPFMLRLELVFLIPYLIRLSKIKSDWMNREEYFPTT